MFTAESLYNRRLQWGDAHFTADRDTYTRRAIKTFRKAEDGLPIDCFERVYCENAELVRDIYLGSKQGRPAVWTDTEPFTKTSDCSAMLVQDHRAPYLEDCTRALGEENGEMVFRWSEFKEKGKRGKGGGVI